MALKLLSLSVGAVYSIDSPRLVHASLHFVVTCYIICPFDPWFPTRLVQRCHILSSSLISASLLLSSQYHDLKHILVFLPTYLQKDHFTYVGI